MKSVFAAILLFTSVSAFADQSWLSNLAFGPSVPQNDTTNNILPQNTSFDQGGQPTRYGGGERITIHFMDPTGKTDQMMPIESIRLLGFSKSGTGAVMVRAITSKPVQDPHFFDPLGLFTAIDASSKAQSREGRVMLGAGDSVYLPFTEIINFSDLTFTFESYGSNDASVVVQIIWQGANPKTTQKIIRRIVNPPVSHSGGGGGGGIGGGFGGGGLQACSSTMQCRGDENCIGNVCKDRMRDACDSGGNSCTPGESCCKGVCQTGSCN